MEPGSWLERVNIRHLIRKDLPALEWEGEYRHYRQVYANAYTRMADGRAVMWVAEMTGEGIIGQAFVQLICDRPELADGATRAYFFGFRVRPVYHSLGLGSQMMQTIELDLYRRKFKRVVLNVAQTNLRAQALYHRLGYRIIAPDPGEWSYYDDKGILRSEAEPAWRMEKTLVYPDPPLP
jgi:ribosomal protein S18 acetylase RimI-like enzyme